MATKEISVERLTRMRWQHPELSSEMIAKYACPTCEGFIPNDLHIGQYPGAISRRDNTTEICSPCGNREAFEDYFGTQKGASA